MRPAFWRGRRVFITGHTGFKGAWLVLWMKRLGADVTGFALGPPTEPSLFELADAGSEIRDLRGDVRDLESLGAALRSASPEIVLHMAAQSLVRTSYHAPVETYSTNVMGTVNLLEAIRGIEGVRSVVVVTSDKCYENREWDRSYEESDPMGGWDPYSSSKGCAELVTSAYRRSFFARSTTRIATARAGNVIGGGDWAADRLVPDLVRSFSSGIPGVVRNPLATRPWQHVLEPLRGYLTLAERLCEGDDLASHGWNFGPRESDVRTVRWVADAAANAWGKGARWEQDAGSHPHEAQTLTLNISKVALELGWSPKVGLEDALAWTVAWYRDWSEGMPPAQLAERDLSSMETLMAAGRS